jgi:hypothetical protein
MASTRGYGIIKAVGFWGATCNLFWRMPHFALRHPG